jgi:GT2 family glycosyltransferase
VSELSVVIPTRNRPSRLRLTLAALAAQQDPGPFEVLIVDEGAGDIGASALVPASLQARFTAGPRHGRAAARNAGASAAAGEVVVFLDDDIVVGPRFLASHRDAHSDGPALVHGRLRELPGAQRALDGRSPECAGLAPATLARRGLRLADLRHFASPLEQAIEALWADGVSECAPWLLSVGANLSVERSAWAELGGFDEGFGRTWGCEDLELGFRAVRAGVKPRFAPAAYGGHLTHARPGRWQEHAASLRRFCELHPDSEVAALETLLAPDGSASRYLAAIGFSRSQPPGHGA